MTHFLRDTGGQYWRESSIESYGYTDKGMTVAAYIPFLDGGSTVMRRVNFHAEDFEEGSRQVREEARARKRAKRRDEVRKQAEKENQ